MKPELIIGAVAVAVIGIIFFLKTTTGAAVGKNLGDGVVNFIGAIGGGIADVATDASINPLEPFGTWLGGTIYDVTHPQP